MVDFDDYSIDLKLETFYCIGVMNQLKMIYYDLVFCSYDNELLFFNRQELLQKAKDRYHNCGGKEKSAKYYLENRGF